jgi:6,7-dimethyl-8-ribityllumazine synthase
MSMNTAKGTTMQGADQGNAGELAGEGLRIGIVRARFNEAITAKLAAGLPGRTGPAGRGPGDIRHVSVPGALEIPWR